MKDFACTLLFVLLRAFSQKEFLITLASAKSFVASGCSYLEALGHYLASTVIESAA